MEDSLIKNMIYFSDKAATHTYDLRKLGTRMGSEAWVIRNEDINIIIYEPVRLGSLDEQHDIIFGIIKRNDLMHKLEICKF